MLDLHHRRTLNALLPPVGGRYSPRNARAARWLGRAFVAVAMLGSVTAHVCGLIDTATMVQDLVVAPTLLLAQDWLLSDDRLREIADEVTSGDERPWALLAACTIHVIVFASDLPSSWALVPLGIIALVGAMAISALTLFGNIDLTRARRRFVHRFA